MTDQLMSLELIKQTDEIVKDATKFRSDIHQSTIYLLIETARAAHAWKAQCETLFQLGDETGKEFRKAREENEKLREQLEECQYNRTRDRLGLEQAMCTIPEYIKDEIDHLLCHRVLDMASEPRAEFGTVSKEIYEHILVSIGSLHQENESLRKDISKALKDSQEFLASTFCEKHKDEVEKESFAEFISKHVCERCIKESLAAKDAEIAELRKNELTEAMIDAPRSLLMIYGSSGLSVGEMRRHCEACGDDISCWPDWAKEQDREHLTKSGTAILIYTMMRAAEKDQAK